MDGSGSKQDFGSALLELQLRLQGGERPEDAIKFLESRGMPKAEARLTVHRLVAKSIKEQRTKGVIWLALAAVCLAIALPFAIAVLGGVAEAEGTSRLFRRGVIEAGTLPTMLMAAGAWLGYRGLKLLLSRRYASDPDR